MSDQGMGDEAAAIYAALLVAPGTFEQIERATGLDLLSMERGLAELHNSGVARGRWCGDVFWWSLVTAPTMGEVA